MNVERSRWFRAHVWLHRWTSVIVTLPFLLLCVTGTILIFHEEIDAALGVMPTSQIAEVVDFDATARAVRAKFPEQRILSMSIDPDGHPGIVLTMVAPPDDRDFDHATMVFSNLAGALLDDADPQRSFTGVVLELHAEWFLGPLGRLLGGVIGLLVLLSLWSGVVIYAPYMKRLAFGQVRRDRGARLWQLDLHNFFGVVILGWALVVSGSGVLLGLSNLALFAWQSTGLTDVRARYAAEAPVDPRQPPASLNRVFESAEAHAGWEPRTLLFPATDYTTPRHFLVLTSGTSGVEAKMIEASLVDASSGERVEILPTPAYLQALFLSEPLHFGNYGGLPLKIVWAACTWLTLFVTGNGAWLFFVKRRRKRAPITPTLEAGARS